MELLERLARLEAALAERDARVEVLARRVAELEALLRKNSRTSSKPPSSDGPAKAPPRSRREPSDRAPGKQPGELGFTLRQVQRPDEVFTHRPGACQGCGASLRRAPVTSAEARQVFDLPPVRLRVVEHRVQHRRCRCGATTMAAVPAGVSAPTQYGPRVRAVGAYLVGYQHLPYERACETLADLLGVGMSVGTLTSVMTRTGDGLAPFLESVREQIAAAPVAHFDETGLRVAGAGAWVHSASTESLSLFRVHICRGHDAIAAAGVLPVFTGIAVHDGFTPYRRYGFAHALCNAHHLRELAAILDMDPVAGLGRGHDQAPVRDQRHRPARPQRRRRRHRRPPARGLSAALPADRRRRQGRQPQPARAAARLESSPSPATNSASFSKSAVRNGDRPAATVTNGSSVTASVHAAGRLANPPASSKK